MRSMCIGTCKGMTLTCIYSACALIKRKCTYAYISSGAVLYCMCTTWLSSKISFSLLINSMSSFPLTKHGACTYATNQVCVHACVCLGMCGCMACGCTHVCEHPVQDTCIWQRSSACPVITLCTAHGTWHTCASADCQRLAHQMHTGDQAMHQEWTEQSDLCDLRHMSDLQLSMCWTALNTLLLLSKAPDTQYSSLAFYLGDLNCWHQHIIIPHAQLTDMHYLYLTTLSTSYRWSMCITDTII